MRSKLRTHLTYANVISTLCLFLLVGGGAAVAAGLKKNAVKSKHIKDGQVASVDVADDGLTGTDIAENTLNIAQAPGNTTPSGPAGGSLTGTYPDPALAPNSVGSGEVANNSLGAIDLGVDSVGISEIATDAVTGAEVANSAIGTDEVADGGLDGDDVGRESGTVTDFNSAPVAANSCYTQSEDLNVSDNMTTDAVVVTVGDGFPDNLSVSTENAVANGFVRITMCNPTGAEINPGSVPLRWVAFDVV